MSILCRICAILEKVEQLCGSSSAYSCEEECVRCIDGRTVHTYSCPPEFPLQPNFIEGFFTPPTSADAVPDFTWVQSSQMYQQTGLCEPSASKYSKCLADAVDSNPPYSDNMIFNTPSAGSGWTSDWTSAFDFSGVSWEGHFGAANGTVIANDMVNDCAVILINKHQSGASAWPIGNIKSFRDPSGAVVQSKIAALWDHPNQPDLSLVKLEPALDESIKVYPTFNPKEVSLCELAAMPVLSTRDNGGKVAVISQIRFWQKDQDIRASLSFENATTHLNFPGQDVIDGDSGNPVFAVKGPDCEMVLLGTFAFDAGLSGQGSVPALFDQNIFSAVNNQIQNVWGLSQGLQTCPY